MAGSRRSDLIQIGVGILMTVVLTIVVWRPAFGDVNADSFPFSTYPMFSRRKTSPSLVLTQVLAVLPDNERVVLPPEVSTGNEEVIQAMGTIARESYGGAKRAKAFCESIAERAIESPDPAWAEATHVAIVRSRFDTVSYFQNERVPIRSVPVHKCPIRR